MKTEDFPTGVCNQGVAIVRKRTGILLLVLLIVISLAGAYFFKGIWMAKSDKDYRNITDVAASYNADKEIAQATARLNQSQEQASIILGGTGNWRQIALTFDGLTDRVVMQQVLDLLNKHKVRATFFVDGIQTAEDPQTVFNIKKEGHKIENYTLYGLPKMENMPPEKLVRDFVRAQKIIAVNIDQGPNLLKCNDTNYSDQLLRAAKACGFAAVVRSEVYVNMRQLNASATADEFVSRLRPGSIVSFKLINNLEQIVYEPGKTDDRPAVDKQPGLRELPMPNTQTDHNVADAVEKVLIALQKAGYTMVYVETFATTTVAESLSPIPLLAGIAAFAREELAAAFTVRKAWAATAAPEQLTEIKQVRTTEPALSFTFGGLANKMAVDDVLGRLQALGIRGTFFTAENEMRRYPETIRRIIADGHEMGIAIRPKDGESVNETRNTIQRSRALLKNQFGVDAYLLKQVGGAVANTTKEA